MGDQIEQAVERVIVTMHNNLGEQLTVDDMARAAMFSKFHFTRIFQRVTGVSPGRFLSALRIQQAKRLLVSTSLNVADISIRVGYNSVGTFSSRFTRSVGMSPTTYRRLGGYTDHIPDGSRSNPDQAGGVVQGQIWRPPTDDPTLVFAGLFPSRIPEGRPVRCTIMDGPGRYLLDKVPEGVWYLLSQSVTGNPQDAVSRPYLGEQALCVGQYGPVTVGRDAVIRDVNVRLKPIRVLDPPVLLALLDARRTAMRLAATQRPDLMTGAVGDAVASCASVTAAASTLPSPASSAASASSEKTFNQRR
jgi:AraC-like DNA-binding protein